MTLSILPRNETLSASVASSRPLMSLALGPHARGAPVEVRRDARDPSPRRRVALPVHALLPLAHRVDRGPAIRLEMPPGRAPRPHTEPAPAVLGRDPGVLGRLALPADAVAAGARADHAHPLL